MKLRIRKPRIRQWAEALLLVLGIAGVSLWAASIVIPWVWQDWGDWMFEEQLRGATATVPNYLEHKIDAIGQTIGGWAGLVRVEQASAVTSVPLHSSARSPSRPITPLPIAENSLIGRLTIPRLHLSAIVREGVSQNTLGLAVGHIPGTAFPGHAGNAAVAGHRDTLFRGLGNIEANDVVLFQTVEGTYEYRVKSTEIVTPQDVEVLNPGPFPELTLVTCYPFSFIGSAPDRFIVAARLVSSPAAPASTLVSAANAGASSPHDLAEAVAAPAESARPLRPVPVAAPGKVRFDISRNHSQTLAPGISMGIDGVDPLDQRVNGWMWIMPDRRTIWLRDQAVHDPIVFYGHEDGRRREVWITNVTNQSASGYLQLPTP